VLYYNILLGEALGRALVRRRVILSAMWVLQ
jgi:hypothetical protein